MLHVATCVIFNLTPLLLLPTFSSPLNQEILEQHCSVVVSQSVSPSHVCLLPLILLLLLLLLLGSSVNFPLPACLPASSLSPRTGWPQRIWYRTSATVTWFPISSVRASKNIVLPFSSYHASPRPGRVHYTFTAYLHFFPPPHLGRPTNPLPLPSRHPPNKARPRGPHGAHGQPPNMCVAVDQPTATATVCCFVSII